MGTESSPMEGRITVKYIPLNDWRIRKIQDVPEQAMVKISSFDSRCPQEGIIILLAGENAEAPLMNIYLKKEFNTIIDGMQKTIDSQATRVAVKELAKKMAESAPAQAFEKHLDELEAIRKKGGWSYTPWEEYPRRRGIE